jgi:hypothetical protein
MLNGSLFDDDWQPHPRLLAVAGGALAELPALLLVTGTAGAFKPADGKAAVTPEPVADPAFDPSTTLGSVESSGTKLPSLSSVFPSGTQWWPLL